MPENGEVKPVPDPSQLTTEQLLRVVRSERDFTLGQVEVISERFRSMDEATKVLSQTVHRVPTDMQQSIDHLNTLMIERFEAANAAYQHILALMDERFSSVSQQFKERDTRAEREARDNKIAVDAAFAAQDKSATKQDEANQKAIDKSERATNDSIIKLGDSATAANKSLSDKIDDNKARIAAQDTILVGVISKSAGGHDAVADRRASTSTVFAAITVGALLLATAVAVITFALTHAR